MPTIIETTTVQAANDIRTLTLDVPQLPKKSMVEITFDAVDEPAIAPLAVGEFVHVVKENSDTGINILGARVTAADTLAIKFENITNQDFDPASQTFILLVG